MIPTPTAHHSDPALFCTDGSLRRWNCDLNAGMVWSPTGAWVQATSLTLAAPLMLAALKLAVQYVEISKQDRRAMIAAIASAIAT